MTRDAAQRRYWTFYAAIKTIREEDKLSNAPICFEEKDQIGLLTLNRPKTINAVDQAMLESLHRLFDELQESGTVRVVILAGAGEKGFCSGMDIKESAPKLFEASCGQIYHYQSMASALIAKMRKIPQPIIAAIDGVAAGAGFSFALAADVRIITPRTRFNAAYINLGLGGADLASSYFLPRLIGAGRAHEFLLTGDFMSAQEAMALGGGKDLINKGGPPGSAAPQCVNLGRTSGAARLLPSMHYPI